MKVQSSSASYTHLNLNRTRLIYDKWFTFSIIKYWICLLFFSGFFHADEIIQNQETIERFHLYQSSKFKMRGLDWQLTKMACPSLTLSLLQEECNRKELRFHDPCNLPLLILKDSPAPRASDHYISRIHLEVGKKKEKRMNLKVYLETSAKAWFFAIRLLRSL